MLSLFCSFFLFRQSLFNHYRSCPGALIMPLSPKCPPVFLPLSDQFLDVFSSWNYTKESLVSLCIVNSVFLFILVTHQLLSVSPHYWFLFLYM